MIKDEITISVPVHGFLDEFPDLRGCLTEGNTIEEAQNNAAEALSGYLASV